MTKLKWNREPIKSSLDSEYWSKPKTGFDKGWHHNWAQKLQSKQNTLDKEINLGIHSTHDLDIVKLNSDPHHGKLICVSCNNKFIRWLSKDFLSNT